MYKLLYACIGIMMLPVYCFAQLTIQLTSIPNNTPMDDDIFVAGTFNGWAEGNTDYILSETEPGFWEITIDPAPGLLKFKFTRGSWDTVEGNANGGYLPDRTYNYTGVPTSISLEILSWEGSGSNSTAADNVKLLDDDFFMPQLNRNRKIWIYLPPDYETTDNTYPVLYMHDAQNLFDVATSFSGEWEVDESLNDLFENGDEGIIVVGIENGGANRLNEYSPWVNPNYGGGEGNLYVDFIVETLKPYVDNNYRTRSARENTGIMGSSMGGLISMYAAIEHQDVFSKAGIFSASFWFSDQVYEHVTSTGKEEDMKFYMIAGALEGGSLGQVLDMNEMYSTLIDAGFTADEVIELAHADGQHSEWYWAREFPDAYEWLWAGLMSGAEEEDNSGIVVRVYPNPAKDTIELKGLPKEGKLTYDLLSMNAQMIRKGEVLRSNRIDVSRLGKGTYTLSIFQNEILLTTIMISKQ